jgi:hypothetical protein
VAVSAAESALAPISDREMSRNFEDGLSIFHSPEEAAASLYPDRRLSVELWKWFLLAALGLMFAEAWLTRRQTSLVFGRTVS